MLEDYLDILLLKFEKLLDNICNENGEKINEEDKNMFVEALFKSYGGVYVGIESKLPREYAEIHHTYIKLHKD